MQDFRTIPGFASRVLGGADGGAADLRRPRGYPPITAASAPVKCPRCDSTNTKFCYYNNYNLSQPRHFCKSCRRYWTKGGVLRNVPVGGGCRKAKRPSSSSSSSSKPPSSASGDAEGKRQRTGDASTSTSSSSLTNPSVPAPPTSNPHPILPFQSPEIFPESAGSFSTLIGSGSSSTLGFGFPDPAQPMAAEEKAIQTQAIVDLRPFHGRSDGGGAITGMDWPGPLDPSLFDLTSAVDTAAYWNQNTLGDGDPSLYLP